MIISNPGERKRGGNIGNTFTSIDEFFDAADESEAELEIISSYQISIQINMDSIKHTKDIEFMFSNLRLILPMDTCKCMLKWSKGITSLMEGDPDKLHKQQQKDLEKLTIFAKRLLAKQMIQLAFKKMRAAQHMEEEEEPDDGLLFSQKAITEARNTYKLVRKEKIKIHGFLKGFDLWLPSKVCTILC